MKREEREEDGIRKSGTCKTEFYVISYDISETKIRNKIFKTLKNYGTHRQYSVFECELSKERFGTLYRELLALMKEEEEGNIRIYKLCKKCKDAISVIGIKEESESEEQEDVIVV